MSMVLKIWLKLYIGIAKIMGSDRHHISLQTVGRVDSFRETNGAAVHDIRHTLPHLFVMKI
jgi:hypothetical protein